MIKEIHRNMDYPLVATVVFLVIAGIIMIHSTSTGENVESSNIWVKQIVWVVFSFMAMLGVIIVSQKFMYAFAYIFYGCGIVLLILTELYGSMGGGAERWLKLGHVRFQPSEFMKIAAILALARYLSYKKNRPTSYAHCIIPFIIVGIPLVLVKMQPDLGTALVFGAMVLPMLYWAGLDTRRLFFLVAPAVSAILTAPFIPFSNPIIWVIFMLVILGVLYYSRYSFAGIGAILSTNILAGIATPIVYNSLALYQQKRITTIFNPEIDLLGAGYQITNSKIAIGSGGLFGKGLGEGRYTELGFLPRANTDFIFSVIGEELGFIGALLILGLMVFIIYRSIMIASEAKNQFVSLTAMGIASVFTFHMFVNIGMAIGIMPVTGLPLPFLSYGGSSCLTNILMVGLLLNFRAHRHDF